MISGGDSSPSRSDLSGTSSSRRVIDRCEAFGLHDMHSEHNLSIGCSQWAAPYIHTIIASETLNSDPYNMRAEELALMDCTIGVEVRRTWSEKQMVCSFDGCIFPGTPDGMFEDWDAALTCVQVVRVPLVNASSLTTMQETLATTILTKVVKSQQWLRASHVAPNEFIIFCWLPFPIPESVAEFADGAMKHVQLLDHRFSLRLRVPAHADSLFPALFACNQDAVAKKARSIAWSDVATYTGSDVESDDDDECTWDITWGWDEDLGEALTNASAASCEFLHDARDDVEYRSDEWDITVDHDLHSSHPLVGEEVDGRLLGMAWKVASDVVILAIVCWIYLVNGSLHVLKENAVAFCVSCKLDLKDEWEISIHDEG